MNITMVSRIYTKPQVQAMLKALRQAQIFSVEKVRMGYEVKHTKSGLLVFKAINGRNSYLVRHADNLFA
tara:strand:+ start:104 stop:310 length:207 start_codon:yes stop_codon:yes gene_type:complete